jgi:four helix bundle protein
MDRGARCHTDLIVWQKAIDLAVAVYEATASFPRSEIFGLSSQLRRAAVSVASNVAEGSARRTTREFIHYLYVARGSLAETQTQLLLSRRLGYLDEARFLELDRGVDVLGRILNALVNGLQRRLALRSD